MALRDEILGKDKIARVTNQQPNPALQSLKQFGGMIKENVLDPVAKGMRYLNPIDVNRRITSGLQQLPQAMKDFDASYAQRIRDAATRRAANPQGTVHVAPWVDDSTSQAVPQLPGQDYKFDSTRFKGEKDYESERFAPTPVTSVETGEPKVRTYGQEEAEQAKANLPQQTNLGDRGVAKIRRSTAQLQQIRREQEGPGVKFGQLQSGLGFPKRPPSDKYSASTTGANRMTAKTAAMLNQQDRDAYYGREEAGKDRALKVRGQDTVAQTAQGRQQATQQNELARLAQQGYTNTLAQRKLDVSEAGLEIKRQAAQPTEADQFNTIKARRDFIIDSESPELAQDTINIAAQFKQSPVKVNSVMNSVKAQLKAANANIDFNDPNVIEQVRELTTKGIQP